MPARLTLTLVSLIVLFSVSAECQAQCPVGPVPLEAFQGDPIPVSLHTQLRFEITNIKAGNAPVNHLFHDLNQIRAAWWKGGYFRQVDRRLIINSDADLGKLHETLIQERVNKLRITLEDQHLDRWRVIPGLRSGIYEQECDITVSLPDCEQRTQLVYTKLAERTQQEIKGETTAHLEVNEAFYKLLSGTLEAYMKDLPLPKYGACVNEIELREFLAGNGTAGYESRGYRLNEGQKSFLNVMAVVMQVSAQDWSPYQLDVKIMGYGDSNKVQQIIDLTSDIEVYYDGCKENDLRAARYLDFFSTAQGNLVKRIISNNCELGAVRAYVATAYLKSKLGTNNVSYSYATGGWRGKGRPVNPADRRVDIEFTMKGARKAK